MSLRFCLVNCPLIYPSFFTLTFSVLSLYSGLHRYVTAEFFRFKRGGGRRIIRLRDSDLSNRRAMVSEIALAPRSV